MEPLLVLILGFFLFLTVGAILGWSAFVRIGQLEATVRSLASRVERAARTGEQAPLPSTPRVQTSAPVRTDRPAPTPANWPAIESIEPNPNDADSNDVGSGDAESGASTLPPPTARPARTEKRLGPDLHQWRSNWMVWLGGISVALAGVFMVRYSIEQGWLGPAARCVAGVVVGLCLQGVAEWLRRRFGPDDSLAALAGGASIMVYTAVLAAHVRYDLVGAWPTFLALAVAAIATMTLGRIHGPVVGALGMIGAFLVPALVGTDQNDVELVLGYILVIAATSLVLMRSVERGWLWMGTFGGVIVWWAASLPAAEARPWHGAYLALAAWLFGSARMSGSTAQGVAEAHSVRRLIGTLVFVTAGAITIARGQAMEWAPTWGTAALDVFRWLPLTIVALCITGRGARNGWLAWSAIGLPLAAFAWLALMSQAGAEREWFVRLPASLQRTMWLQASGMAATCIAIGALRVRRRADDLFWPAIVALAPVLWLAGVYVLTDGPFESDWWPLGSAAAGVAAMAYGWTLVSKSPIGAWLIVGGQVVLCLAAAMVVQHFGLTLTLALAVLTTALLIHRRATDELAWLLKLLVSVLAARLSVHLWLIESPLESHLSLVGFAGSTAAVGIAAWRLRADAKLARWLELAAAHMLVLTLWIETRYWLYDGDVLAARYDFTEAALNVNFLGVLAAVYALRARVAAKTRECPVYLVVSAVLVGLALLAATVLWTALNPLWARVEISTQPVWNGLLLGYGLPAIVAVAVGRTREEWRSAAHLVASVSAFIFVNLTIRHAWNGGVHVELGMSDAEMYTYSAVWLAIATGTLVAARIRQHSDAYRIGVGMLAAVIVKIFGFDMADLEGLLRVASFLGLGLSLLGVAYLLHRLNDE